MSKNDYNYYYDEIERAFQQRLKDDPEYPPNFRVGNSKELTVNPTSIKAFGDAFNTYKDKLFNAYKTETDPLYNPNIITSMTDYNTPNEKVDLNALIENKSKKLFFDYTTDPKFTAKKNEDFYLLYKPFTREEIDAYKPFPEFLIGNKLELDMAQYDALDRAPLPKKATHTFLYEYILDKFNEKNILNPNIQYFYKEDRKSNTPSNIDKNVYFHQKDKESFLQYADSNSFYVNQNNIILCKKLQDNKQKNTSFLVVTKNENDLGYTLQLHHAHKNKALKPVYREITSRTFNGIDDTFKKLENLQPDKILEYFKNKYENQLPSKSEQESKELAQYYNYLKTIKYESKNGNIAELKTIQPTNGTFPKTAVLFNAGPQQYYMEIHETHSPTPENTEHCHYYKSKTIDPYIVRNLNSNTIQQFIRNECTRILYSKSPDYVHNTQTKNLTSSTQHNSENQLAKTPKPKQKDNQTPRRKR